MAINAERCAGKVTISGSGYGTASEAMQKRMAITRLTGADEIFHLGHDEKGYWYVSELTCNPTSKRGCLRKSLLEQGLVSVAAQLYPACTFPKED